MLAFHSFGLDISIHRAMQCAFSFLFSDGSFLINYALLLLLLHWTKDTIKASVEATIFPITSHHKVNVYDDLIER